jgi:glutathionyl-hydroquinone reductase
VKHFNTLIRLKKREVDTLRKQMHALNEQRTVLEQVVSNLDSELQQEVSTAGELINLGVYFADYSEANKKKKEAVEEKITALDKQRDMISRQMMALYGEQKKYEIALRRKQEARAYELERQEQQFIDEQAGIRHAHSQ